LKKGSVLAAVSFMFATAGISTPVLAQVMDVSGPGLNGYNNSAGSNLESIAPAPIHPAPADQSSTNDIAANSLKRPALNININSAPPESASERPMPTPRGTPGRHPNLRPDLPID
jgi:hypothetical protein